MRQLRTRSYRTLLFLEFDQAGMIVHLNIVKKAFTVRLAHDGVVTLEWICTENREYSEPRISMINGLGCVSNCGSPAAKKHCSDAALNSHQGLGSDSCLHPGSVERSPSD